MVASAAASRAIARGRPSEESVFEAFGEADVNKKGKEAERPNVPTDETEITLSVPVPAPAEIFCLPCLPRAEERTSRWRLTHVANYSTLHTFTKDDSRCELWASLWSTSRILAELVEAAGGLLQGARTIEIGSGTALCGIIAAFHGACVTVTDSSALSLHLARQSAALNQVDSKLLSTRVLNWHTDDTKLPQRPHQLFDVLLGSDVLFLTCNVDAVARVVARCLRPGGIAVILDPGRPSADTFEKRVASEPRLSVEAYEASDLLVSKGRLLKRAVLYIITGSSVGLSPRTVALKHELLRAWEMISMRPTTGHESYEYTEQLSGSSSSS